MTQTRQQIGRLTASLSPLGCLHLRLLCRFLIGSCLLSGRRPEHGLSYSWTARPPADLMDRNLLHCENMIKQFRWQTFVKNGTFQYPVERDPLSPDGASGWRQWAHEVGDVVRNVDGQWGNLGLDGLDRWFRHVPWLLLVIGQGGERDLYTGAGEPEATPANKRWRVQTRNINIATFPFEFAKCA